MSPALKTPKCPILLAHEMVNTWQRCNDSLGVALHSKYEGYRRRLGRNGSSDNGGCMRRGDGPASGWGHVADFPSRSARSPQATTTEEW